MKAQTSTGWLCILYLFFLIPFCQGQMTKPVFSHLSVDEGLSQSSVYAITQDRKGFIWLGTRDGLNRYDSRQVVVYRNQPTRRKNLPSNTINALLHDSQGRLWVGTSKGLALYKSEGDDFERISAQGLPDSTILSITEDRRHRVWVGTSKGLYQLEGPKPYRLKSLRSYTYQRTEPSHPNTRALFEDRQGNLWLGTSLGLTQLKARGNGQLDIHDYFLQPADSVYHNLSNGINTIAQDPQGRLWLGTDRKGIAVFDPRLGKISSWNPVPGLDLSTQTIRTIQPDGSGHFWIGTLSGLYVVASDGSWFKTLTNEPTDAESLSDNSVRSIFRDRDGSIWVGTYYGGVDFYSPYARQFGSFGPLGETFKIAGPILPSTDGRQIWLGTEDRGVMLINANRSVARHYRHDPKDPKSLSNDKVKCLLAEGNQGLWIGTLKGLNYLDLRTQVITRFLHEPNNPHSLPNDRIYDLKRDAQGKLWILTNLGGLCAFDPKKQSFESYVPRAGQHTSLSSRNATCLLLDHQQQLWVGTTSGLNRKLPGRDAFVRYQHRETDPMSLSSDHLVCLYEDRKHRLWVGTREGGLNLLRPGQQGFERFSTANGLPSNTIVGIQEDRQGHLWISTDKGLAHFDPEHARFVHYNRHDGLVCKEFTPNSTYQDPQGYLYFGGYNGIVHFHPDSIRRNTRVPQLAFTQVRLFNEPITRLSESGEPDIDFERGLTFTHQQNVFSIDFAAFNYINSSKNRYAYQLMGFDEEWNYVSEPRALYMNLNPGTYVLRVKGSNNDDVWNSKPLELTITVLPPLWKTPLAYVVYALTFVALLRLWSRFNRNRLQLAHELQREHEEKKRQQELHQTKLNFFTEIAHEIRTPLTLVMGPLEVLASQYGQEPGIHKQVSLMRASTDRLLRLLNQLLDFRKHETGNVQLQRQQADFVRFLRQIVHSFLGHARSRQVQLNFESEGEEIPLWFDAGEMEKVISNLLVNAFKFTPAGGRITVQVRATQEEVTLLIEDTGLGIPAEEISQIFKQFYQADRHQSRDTGFGLGLALSKSIVEQHQGQISVESQEAGLEHTGFTRFKITLPILPVEEPLVTLPEPAVCEALPVVTRSEPAAGEKPLLLIVEDQADIRNYLVDLLTTEYQVLEASNGVEAWETASQLLPDLLITDLAMPEMDGLTLTHRLKTDARTSHIPVIMLTAKDGVDHQLSGLQTGADDYLTKPFHPVLLRARVQNLLLLRQQLKTKYHRLITLQPQAQTLEHPDEKFLNQLMTVLDQHLADPDFNVGSLVAAMGMSRPVLFRKVKMLTDRSVVDLLRTTRLKKAKMLLQQRKANVSEIAFAVGFSDPKYFSRAFRAEFGLTPTEYSQQVVTEETPS